MDLYFSQHTSPPFDSGEVNSRTVIINDCIIQCKLDVAEANNNWSHSTY
jgi:hypothetical protein